MKISKKKEFCSLVIRFAFELLNVKCVLFLTDVKSENLSFKKIKLEYPYVIISQKHSSLLSEMLIILKKAKISSI